MLFSVGERNLLLHIMDSYIGPHDIIDYEKNFDLAPFMKPEEAQSFVHDVCVYEGEEDKFQAATMGDIRFFLSTTQVVRYLRHKLKDGLCNGAEMFYALRLLESETRPYNPQGPYQGMLNLARRATYKVLGASRIR